MFTTSTKATLPNTIVSVMTFNLLGILVQAGISSAEYSDGRRPTRRKLRSSRCHEHDCGRLQGIHWENIKQMVCLSEKGGGLYKSALCGLSCRTQTTPGTQTDVRWDIAPTHTISSAFLANPMKQTVLNSFLFFPPFWCGCFCSGAASTTCTRTARSLMGTARSLECALLWGATRAAHIIMLFAQTKDKYRCTTRPPLHPSAPARVGQGSRWRVHARASACAR